MDTLTSPSSWTTANQHIVGAYTAWLRAMLEQGDGVQTERGSLLEAATSDLSPPPAIEHLRVLFGLTPFERDILMLCAAVELDATVARLVSERLSDPRPTFSFALASLPGAHWSALSPDRPLRLWRLLEVGSGPTLTMSPLRIDERILHFIAGVPHLDTRLAAIVDPREATQTLVPSHHELAARVARIWSSARPDGTPVVQLCGPDPESQIEIAVAAAGQAGLTLFVADARLLPTSAIDASALARLWEREAALGHGALLLDCHAVDSDDATGNAALLFAERTRTPIVLATRDRRAMRRRAVISMDVPRPQRSEQRALWQAALGSHVHLNGELDSVVDGLDLAPLEISAAGGEAGTALAGPATDLAVVLWDAGRLQARPRLDGLAARIEPAAGWDDLVLPEAQRAILREIAMHVRHRARVYDEWGFATKGSRGLGISALFSGASGTGKTTAAEVLANELRLDLYRIDLSAVVSKYIGETEKNLRRVFDAAEGGGAILLFDEADALFGKRSEVRDSHDRYANIEVSYLLQRMETYRGLAVLTTNLRGAIDTAFTRRIRFIVPFPFPDATQRAEIWRRAFPAATPLGVLDIAQLAQLNISGGSIRNIALSAAFFAAAEASPVGMHHLLAAARGEYAKVEKPMTKSEIEGWS